MAEATVRPWTGLDGVFAVLGAVPCPPRRWPRHPLHRSHLHHPDLRQLRRRRPAPDAAWTAAGRWPRPPAFEHARAADIASAAGADPGPLCPAGRGVRRQRPSSIAAPTWAAPSPPSATSRCGTPDGSSAGALDATAAPPCRGPIFAGAAHQLCRRRSPSARAARTVAVLFDRRQRWALTARALVPASEARGLTAPRAAAGRWR